MTHTDPLLSELDKLETTLKLAGEQIAVGYIPEDSLFHEERFWVRLEPHGHGGGSSLPDAYREALAAREDHLRKQALREQVEAEVERRMQPRKAA